MLAVRFLTAVPALRCPLRAFGEPSWTCFIARVTNHSSPGITVSFSGIRRAKLDVLHTTSTITAVPALRCPSRAFGEPSWTCSTPQATNHSSPGVTVSFSGIRRAKQDITTRTTRHNGTSGQLAGTG